MLGGYATSITYHRNEQQNIARLGDMKRFFATRPPGVQFNFSGEMEGLCHLIIKDGRCEALEGAAKAPQLTIDTPFEVWMDIMTGKADGRQMFTERKYTARGDLPLTMRMGDLLGNG